VPVNPADELGELGLAFNTMAASLERAERQRRDMTADIAHELRNPIAVLQANLEGVIDGVLPPTPENLTPLLDQTHMLTRLVDDLRTVALADAGQLGLQRENTDLLMLGRSAVAQFQSQANANGVSLSLEAPAGLPAAMVDPQRITQVLGNLLSNALRHTPAGSTTTLRLSLEPKPPSRVSFSVHDSGPGIPPEVLPHIFERFYRADQGRSRLDGGTGLGLTIAKQLVEAHGGTIWALSEPGQAAEVGFNLSAAGR
jgi:two-component system OmpR family sensor kinase/two-component system sensor histidine kinase BaeS